MVALRLSLPDTRRRPFEVAMSPHLNPIYNNNNNNKQTFRHNLWYSNSRHIRAIHNYLRHSRSQIMATTMECNNRDNTQCRRLPREGPRLRIPWEPLFRHLRNLITNSHLPGPVLALQNPKSIHPKYPGLRYLRVPRMVARFQYIIQELLLRLGQTTPCNPRRLRIRGTSFVTMGTRRRNLSDRPCIRYLWTVLYGGSAAKST